MDTARRRDRVAQFMSDQQRQWRAGDPLAVARATFACFYDHRPLPRWLRDAILTLVDHGMTDAERRMYYELEKHRARWRAVIELRQRSPRALPWDKCWPEAAKRLEHTDAFGSEHVMKKSYSLIQAAGGERCTLESYRLAVAKREPAAE